MAYNEELEGIVQEAEYSARTGGSLINLNKSSRRNKGSGTTEDAAGAKTKDPPRPADGAPRPEGKRDLTPERQDAPEAT